MLRFWLNLYGKNIDALHHSRVSLRIYNTSESEIYFFHQQRGSQALHVSDRFFDCIRFQFLFAEAGEF